MTTFSYKINLGRTVLIPGRISSGTEVGLDAAALYVKGNASKYPGVRRLKVAQYWTPKQRRYFFWAKAHGEIVVPYTRGSNPRSQRLMARWGIRKRPGARTIGNNASYAGLVHGMKQSLYHKGNWRDIRQIGKAVGPEARRLVKAGITGKLQGR